jgi:hypothetical protein
MKFTKMSLVAALLIGSSAFAIENTKVSGDANLYYSTKSQNDNNANTNDDLFNKQTSKGEASLHLGLTTDLTKNVSAGAAVDVISTLGLANNLVSTTWTGATEDTYVVSEAWLAATFGETTGKVGRMELDTPLVYSETWSLVTNTFEAGVLINQDIPDTTLVAAYVGQHDTVAVMGDGIAQATSPFVSFYDGAYAFGVINSSIKPITVQAWYYDAQKTVKAYWLQADLDASELGVKGLVAGAQYSSQNFNDAVTLKKNDVYALMLGYSIKDIATVKVAYSSVGKDTNGGDAGYNLATGSTSSGTAQSKLYTEAWWNYGKVTQNDTDSYKISLESPVQGLFDLGIYYTNADQSTIANNNDLSEITLTASKSFGPLDATLVYINADVKTPAVGDDETSDTIQAYLTLNF